MDVWQAFLWELTQYLLFHQLLKLSLKLIPLVAGVMVVYHFVMRMKAEDDHTAAQHLRSIRNTLVVAAVLFASGNLLYLTARYSGFDAYAPCHGFIWGEQYCADFNPDRPPAENQP